MHTKQLKPTNRQNSHKHKKRGQLLSNGWISRSLFLLFLFIPCQLFADIKNPVDKLSQGQGLVLLSVEGRTGTAFFIQPGILVTAFHNIISENVTPKDDFSPLKDHIFIYENSSQFRSDSIAETRQRNIPIEEIEAIALDGKHDLAIFRLHGGFQSDEFFPVPYNPVVIKGDGYIAQDGYWRPFSIHLAGFPSKRFMSIEGREIRDLKYEETSESGLFWGFTHNVYHVLKGMSGAPVLYSDGVLAGVLVEGRIVGSLRPEGMDTFVSARRLKNLLEQASLSCFDTSCLHQAMSDLQTQAEAGDRQAQWELGSISKKSEKWLWWEQAAENGHPAAQFYMGRRQWHFDGGNTYWLRKSAEQGYLPAFNFYHRREEYTIYQPISEKRTGLAEKIGP